MSLPYERVMLLVSRLPALRGSTKNREDITFFRSTAEYNRCLAKRLMELGDTSSEHWYVRPIRIDALVRPMDYRRFLGGEELPLQKVFFSAESIDLILGI
jgi:hypothetical protein